jgi:hypothetical protein
MAATVPNPKRAAATAALFSLLNTKRHLALAMPHNLAAELESSQTADNYRNGLFPRGTWHSETEAQALVDLAELRRTLLKTGVTAIALALAALAIVAATGKVHPSLPIDYGKVVTSVGGTSAAWAGLLQLSPIRKTFRGSMLHEVAYSAAVMHLGIVGVLLAAVGGLWWQ